MSSLHKPQIGLQNSVLAFADPLHPAELSTTIRRTGEGLDMPVQDGAPSPEQYFDMLHGFGVDFLMHQVMPGEQEHLRFLDEMAKRPELGFLMANEFANVNMDHVAGTNRGDFSEAVATKAKTLENFMGFLYDETEHLQIHANMYRRDPNAPTQWQWADPAGKTLEQTEQAVTDAVAADAKRLGCPLFSEHVFPILYHAFARGGMNPAPKVLKEEFQSLQLATALGAAVQYKRKFGICVDLWGTDIGPWFTRKWGFPGHSPADFENALRMAWHYSPEFLFVENMDPLVRFSAESGFRKTEFGDIFERFIRDYVPAHPLGYSFRDAQPDIALVRSDDGIFQHTGTFAGGGLYGSDALGIDHTHSSIFKAWHLLSHGTISDKTTFYNVPYYDIPKDRFPVNQDTIRQLPLENGVVIDGWDNAHGLFYPMNGVLVYDHYATVSDLAPAKLIVAAGSRMSAATAEAMLTCARNGATLLSASWLMPEGYRTSQTIGSGRLIITESFDEPDILAQIAPLLGDSRSWTQRFGEQRLHITNPAGDGIALDITTI